MTLTIEQARKVKRPTIRVGRKYEFHSSVVGLQASYSLEDECSELSPLIRNFTGQRVRVLKIEFKPGDEGWEPGGSEYIYQVQADDGTVFLAMRDELNGWAKDTGQFVGPSGKWGSEK